MAFDPDNLRLTDFMDLSTLQEIQDSFAAVANVKATITDADGTYPPERFADLCRAVREQAADIVEAGAVTD